LVKDKLLEKEIKTPYLPPPEKLLSDLEIKQLEQSGKLVVDEIKVSGIILNFPRLNKVYAPSITSKEEIPIGTKIFEKASRSYIQPYIDL
jgi:hypothetical protein